MKKEIKEINAPAIDLIADILHKHVDAILSEVRIRFKQIKEGQSSEAAEPVAWISDSPTKGNGRRLFWTKADAWRWSSNVKPLYATPEIPEGYKFVPIEPTDEMIEAADRTFISTGHVATGKYKAMLEAAPEPKEQ